MGEASARYSRIGWRGEAGSHVVQGPGGGGVISAFVIELASAIDGRTRMDPTSNREPHERIWCVRVLAV